MPENDYHKKLRNTWAINREADKRLFEDKVRKMLDKKLQCEGVCWPVDLLRNAEGGFVGVLVPAAEGYQLKQQLMSQQGLEEHFPNWNRRQLTHLVKVILEKIVFLRSIVK